MKILVHGVGAVGARAARYLIANDDVSDVLIGDSIPAVRDLLDLDAEARERGLAVVVGAAFAPGLSCVLARHAASLFDEVDEIHVARHGTGGPSCARQH